MLIQLLKTESCQNVFPVLSHRIPKWELSKEHHACWVKMVKGFLLGSEMGDLKQLKIRLQILAPVPGTVLI